MINQSSAACLQEWRGSANATEQFLSVASKSLWAGHQHVRTKQWVCVCVCSSDCPLTYTPLLKLQFRSPLIQPHEWSRGDVTDEQARKVCAKPPEQTHHRRKNDSETGKTTNYTQEYIRSQVCRLSSAKTSPIHGFVYRQPYGILNFNNPILE